jgi:2,4-dienoyl-CoA reductase (NADPH2)
MKLFEPCKIRNMELKNRVVLAPMSNNLMEDGFITQRAINFYMARARGGVGLITCEDGIVDFPLGNNVRSPVGIDNDKYIPMLKKLNEAIHAYGTKTVMQLAHAGRRAGRVAKSGYLEVTRGKIPVGPSELAHPAPGYVVPKELSTEGIREVVEQFGQGARRAGEAGFDAIGLHCAHMYLCGEFLSPWANKRTDEYGGSFEGRLRFVLEVIDRIKKEAGSAHPILLRMNGMEPEGGNSLDDIRRIAQAFEQAGVDAIHVSVGFAATIKDPTFIPSITSMRFSDGPIVHLAKNIKKGVHIPVIAVNKIRDPQFAERILQEGKADLIAMARTLIADPDFVNKAMEGKYADIRPCISCCQGCIQNVIEKDLPMSCTVNPMAGREGEFPMIDKADVHKKVLIVGGGPGGLEAALIASKMGHEVTIYEKQDRLGGQLIDSAIPPHKTDITRLTNYFKNQIRKRGLKVKLNTEVTPALVAIEKPDLVVIAAGAEPIMPEIPGVKRENVVTSVDVLEEKVEVGEKAVIIGGGQLGVELAEFLSEKGSKVTIVEMLSDVGIGMPSQTRMPLLFSLEDYGVNILTLTKAEEITESGVVVSQRGEKTLIEADTIALAVGYKGRQKFSESFKVSAPEVYSIGNSIKPGNILDAVNHGFEVAIKI